MLSTETATQKELSRNTVLSADPAGKEVESTLLGWWQELLGLGAVALDDDFFELGGDSLIGVQLFNRIKKTYGLSLVLSTLFEARTIRQLTELIYQENELVHAEAKPWSPIVPIQPDGSKRPLYWIPGGYGTTVLPFREVALLLGPDQPVYGLEAKMPSPNEELESIPERAARFAKEIRSAQPKGPYSLVGWCGGGYVAFEMAQELSKEGQAVDFLAIIECAVPRHPASQLGKIQFFVERTTWRFKNFLKRGPKGIVQWAAERSKPLAKSTQMQADGVHGPSLEEPNSPSALSMDEMDERAWRNVDRYYPGTYRGKSIVIVGKDSWAHGGVSSSVDPRLAWCKLSEGGSEIRIVPGDHMEILKAPNSFRFAQELMLCLERSRASSS